MFSNIRTSIGLNIIKRKNARLKRIRVVHNFQTASNIVILFDASDSESFSHIKSFRNSLEKQNINSDLIGYVDDDEIPDDLLLWDNCDVYCKKDLDLLYKIKKHEIEKFYEKDFDILFDLSLEDHLPLVYLSSLSKASFKVGRYKESYNDYDLMINIDKEKTVDFFIEQIKNYVSMLNKY